MVRATRVTSLSDHRDTPGAFELKADEAGIHTMTYICQGCQCVGSVKLRGPGAVMWDQNKTAPTIDGQLSPPCGCKWKLTSGNWERC